MIELKATLMTCLVMWSFLLSICRCSGLNSIDLVRLLDEDWSVIEKAAAEGLVQASQHRAVEEGRSGVGSLPDKTTTALQPAPHIDAIAPPPSNPESVTHQQSGFEEPVGEQPSRERVPIPMSLEVVDLAHRKTELETLSAAIRNLLIRPRKPRRVLPLIIDNLSAKSYERYFKYDLSQTDKPNFRWTHSGATYLFSKPVKVQSTFQELFGAFPNRNEEFWTVWRLQVYGKAKVWHLLGIIEMPSYRSTQQIMKEHMTGIPPPHSLPDWFFQNGAHLDPSQAAPPLRTAQDTRTAAT